jgi:hypothetical protein
MPTVAAHPLSETPLDAVSPTTDVSRSIERMVLARWAAPRAMAAQNAAGLDRALHVAASRQASSRLEVSMARGADAGVPVGAAILPSVAAATSSATSPMSMTRPALPLVSASSGSARPQGEAMNLARVALDATPHPLAQHASVAGASMWSRAVPPMTAQSMTAPGTSPVHRTDGNVNNVSAGAPGRLPGESAEFAAAAPSITTSVGVLRSSTPAPEMIILRTPWAVAGRTPPLAARALQRWLGHGLIPRTAEEASRAGTSAGAPVDRMPLAALMPGRQGASMGTAPRLSARPVAYRKAGSAGAAAHEGAASDSVAFESLASDSAGAYPDTVVERSLTPQWLEAQAPPPSPAPDARPGDDRRSPAAQEGRAAAVDVDELIERAWREVLHRLTIEQERRGYGRWS